MSAGEPTTLTIIPRDRQQIVPWRNGGGSTRVIAVDAADASAEPPFRWRVSTASIASDGPFSLYPGVQRTLWLLGGNGVTLDLGSEEIVLDTALAAASFAGDVAVTARLHNGPVDDLNVMSDRQRVQATSVMLSLLRAGEWHRSFAHPGQDLLYVIAGAPVLHLLGRPDQVLHQGEAALVSNGRAGRRVALASGPEPATVLVASFTALET